MTRNAPNTTNTNVSCQWVGNFQLLKCCTSPTTNPPTNAPGTLPDPPTTDATTPNRSALNPIERVKSVSKADTIPATETRAELTTKVTPNTDSLFTPTTALSSELLATARIIRPALKYRSHTQRPKASSVETTIPAACIFVNRALAISMMPEPPV